MLNTFSEQLALFDKYQGFIEKAREMSEKFTAGVVQKVVSDNTARMEEVAAVLDPLVPELHEAIRRP